MISAWSCPDAAGTRHARTATDKKPKNRRTVDMSASLVAIPSYTSHEMTHNSERITWRDSSVLMNCLTIVMIACLVPRHPFTEQKYLAFATWIFAALAIVNHLFPQRMSWLTHVVKAAYTNVLFASVAPSMTLGTMWWLPPVAV